MKESDSQIDLKRRVLDGRDLGNAVYETCKRVLNLILQDEAVRDDLGAKFASTLDDLLAIEIRQLEPDLGAFNIENGVVYLSEVEVTKLISFVIADIHEQIVEHGVQMSSDDIYQTLNDALALFALHELRHCSQGVEKYATVQTLKGIEGRNQLAKFDIQADRDAAVALAASRAGDLSSDEFYEEYRRALFFSVQYFFRIYPANAERQDKVCRVAALILMLARLELFLTLGRLTVGDPLTSLQVCLGNNQRSIAVLENEPNNRLLAAANDIAELPEFVAAIEQGRLDDALGKAFSLSLAIGLV